MAISNFGLVQYTHPMNEVNTVTRYAIRPELPREIDQELAPYSPLVRKLLYARGILTKKSAEQFLSPNYEEDLHDPFLLPDMEKSVVRILAAIERGERIVIFGDYDADGVPGSALLANLFEKIGYKDFSVHIPHRHIDGYSLNLGAIETFVNQGVKLLITVDCGITDIEEVAAAKVGGIDVIITDHHEPHDELPDAFAIVNVKRKDATYPFPYLCGAGTAFKLAQALIARGNFGLPIGWEKWLLDLAGLSTICDMVPLQGENRAIAKFGLAVLSKTRRPGLVSMMRKLRLEMGGITEDDVAFSIGPRINTASRMTHGQEAFELLSTNDWVRARALGDHLDSQLKIRNRHSAKVADDIAKEFSDGTSSIVVAGRDDWHLGVLSFAANRVLEKYGRPVCLWAPAEGKIRGSIRSDGSVKVLELFYKAGGKDLFLDFGGHDVSGGFSIAKEKITELKPRLTEAYEDIGQELVLPEIVVDGTLSLAAVTYALEKEIRTLAPFGVGNPKPLFLFENVRIATKKIFGADSSHIEFTLTDESGVRVKAISFFNALEYKDRVQTGDSVSIIGSIERSTFGGTVSLRIRIEEILTV